jgi:hypothetical protein
MGTSDLRADSGVTDRAKFTRAMDELQAAMLVIPSEGALPAEVHLHLDARRGALSRRAAAARGEDNRRQGDSRAASWREPGMTVPGELARVTGLSRPEAGLGNRALVAEGFADMLSPGTYG